MTLRETDKEDFLGRWSRLKREADAAEARTAPPAAPDTGPAPDKDRAPELTPLDQLTGDSDYRDFFHPKVDENVRRSALKKLFSDPHYNIMDGLDTYIDDYSKTEPIPPEMLAGLVQAQKILKWASEKPGEHKYEVDDVGDKEKEKAIVQPDAEATEGAESPPDLAAHNATSAPLEAAQPEPPTLDAGDAGLRGDEPGELPRTS